MKLLASSLGRIVTPGRRFIPEIDGLRFIAIAIVVLFHLHGWVLSRVLAAGTGGPGTLSNLLVHGDYGVRLFFVLSGFILALPFAREQLTGGTPVSLASYFKRRVTRLEPPYVILMTLFFAARVASDRFSADDLWQHFLAGVLYLHNAVFGAMNPVNCVAWSLEVEIQFYLLTPLLARVFSIQAAAVRRALLAAVVAAFAVANAVLVPQDAFRWHGSILGHLQEFLAGYLLADLYIATWREAPARSRAWDLVSVAAWGTIVALLYAPRWASTALPFMVLAAYAAALRGHVSGWFFSRRWIVTIGGMCYTIYLVHYGVISIAGRIADRFVRPGAFPPTFVMYAAVVLPMVLAVSVFFFAVLERPCMNPNWLETLVASFRRPSQQNARNPSVQ